MSSSIRSTLPYFIRGPVVKGFGRGSKDLGIPTANFPEEVVAELPATLSTGIYYGWAKVSGGDVYKMVVSVGWNPFYNNEKKSIETHIMHRFEEDFYDETLSIIIVGYIRDEKNFSSLDELVAAIHADIAEAEKALESETNMRLKTDPFFTS